MGAPEPPKKPRIRRIVLQDATVEAIANILMDNPGGVLYYKDELSGWFGGMDAYKKASTGGVDRPAWLEAYQGGKRRVDRVTSGDRIVPNWSISLIGGVQPSKMAGIAERMDDDGLLARFMPVVIPPDERFSHDRPSDKSLFKAYYDVLERLRDTPATMTPVQYSPDARKLWIDLVRFAKSLSECSLIPPMLGSHLGKWEGLFSRLALTFHMIECAVHNVHHNSLPITKKTAGRVDQFMRRFLLPHAVSFYSETLGQSAEDKTAKMIAELILVRRWKRVTRRDLVNYCQTFKKAEERQRKRAIDFLVDAGWLLPPPILERETKSWVVNPKVHALFAAQSSGIEAKRRKDAEGFLAIRNAYQKVQ